MRLIAVVVGGVNLRRRERFRSFSYDELAGRDKVNLDITWLRDEPLEDLDNLPAPEVIAREIVEDLTAALAEFEAVAAALEAAAHGAATDGAVRVYEITAQDPGPLPIRNVVVSLTFGPEVRPLQYDGAIDRPGRTLTMRQPVVLGLSTRTWKRTIVLPFGDRSLLEGTTAAIAFTPADAALQTNHMDGRAPTIEPSA